jgi:hypothetical protein
MPVDEQPSAQPRKIPTIPTKGAIVQYAGFGYKIVCVQAPDDLTFSDLNSNPTIWRQIQQDRNGVALTEWDVVEIRARDWMATARVNHALADRVVLFDIKRASKPDRELALPSDENYQVIWASEGGYSYCRRSDGQRMSSSTWPTPASAWHECMLREYPQTSGGGRIG